MGREQPRLLITTSTLPLSEGDGQARFVLDLAAALSAGAKVTVLAPHAPGAATSEMAGSVRIRRFRYFIPWSLQKLAYGPGMRHNIEASLLARIQIPFLLIAQVLATALVVLREDVTAINAHWLIPQGMSSALVARLLRVPLVLHVHAADVYFLKRGRVGRSVARFVVRSSTAILADGSHVRDELDQLLGFPSRARLRPMGVWHARFNRAIPRPEGLPNRYVAVVGRLVEKKGVEYLIRALPRVRQVAAGIEAVVVGDGPLRQSLEDLAGEEGVAGLVHFVGPRPHDYVAAVLAHADVTCVPSIIDSRGETEGMPTVVLEAMAAGTRVVGTAVDGIPDVLSHAENGWLAQPADSGDLAAKLVAALNDPDASAVAANGTLTALEHDWERVADVYMRVIREAIDG